MAPIDDDPELAREIAAANAKLAAEGVPETRDEDVAETGVMPEPNESEGSSAIDLLDDLDRLDRLEKLEDPPDEDAEQAPELKPAMTLNELRDAVAVAKMHGIKIIEADKKVIWYYTKPNYPKGGFMHFDSVMVVETGRIPEVQKTLNLSTEEVIFGRGAR